MNTIIEIKDLCKIFKDSAQEIWAVNHVTLDISAGEFTAIVGPSGSGKTTLLNLKGKKRADINKRAVELLESVGLSDRMDSRPAKLSGGQQQRVAVARALASKPGFVLADEPTANLDSKSAENLLEIMEQLNKKAGITFYLLNTRPPYRSQSAANHYA